jgi:AcrR family transcriptional regulator
MARTPKSVEDRREQIIDAAMQIFAEKGFARATNRDIAEKAGITTGLIYYYFKSKEDLLKAALEERSPLQVMAQISPAMLEQPPEILLPLLIRRVLAVVESEQFVSIIRMVIPEMLHGSAEVSPLVLSFFQRVVGFLEEYLLAQVARGTLRADLDTVTTAQVIAGSIVGMVMRRQIMRDPNVQRYTHEELVHAILDTVMRGIQAR